MNAIASEIAARYNHHLRPRAAPVEPVPAQPALPDASWPRSDIRDWLKANNIEPAKNASKSELLMLVGFN